MRKTVITVVLGLLPMLVLASDEFTAVFELQRAMHGPGHQFEWQGQQYSTDHPEEIEAAVAATRTNAQALLAKAVARNNQVAALGNEWRYTRKLLAQGQTAIDQQQYRQALNLAARASYQARMALRQYHEVEASWMQLVPR